MKGEETTKEALATGEAAHEEAVQAAEGGVPERKHLCDLVSLPSPPLESF